MSAGWVGVRTCGLVRLTNGAVCILPLGHAHTCLPAPANRIVREAAS